MVVAVLLVLSAIAVPMFLSTQKDANAQTVRTGLAQASVIIEQQKTDLNGVYPRYSPTSCCRTPPGASSHTPTPTTG